MSEYLYVISNRYNEARDFANKKKLPISRLCYVFDRHRLMGLKRGTKVYILDSAKYRLDFDEIMLEVKIRDFEIEYIGD